MTTSFTVIDMTHKLRQSMITTAEMNGFFEEAILTAPELYGWEYKKFRKLRPNKSNIY